MQADWRRSLRDDTREKLRWIEANTRIRASARVDSFGQWLVLVEDGSIVRRLSVTDDQWDGAASEAVEWIAARGM